MAEQHKKSVCKKRPLSRENAESGGGKKSGVLALAVTCSPPRPAAARTSKLAAPSPVVKARPTAMVAVNTPVAAMPPELAGPNPVTVTKRATTVGVTSLVNAMPPELAALSPAATMAPATPSPVATRTLTPAPPSPVATAKPVAELKPEDEGAEQAMVAAEEEAPINLDLSKKWLHCAMCPAPLKPPVFKCENEHFVCSACGGDDDGANKHCGPCGRRDVPYTHSRFMDGLVDACKVPCPYKSFGCEKSFAYHSIADHKAMCGHAPCYCFECMPPFQGSPANLLRHLTAPTGQHSWPAERIRYEKCHTFAVPASSSDHRRLLVAEDGHVFLLAVGAGRGPAGRRPVNVMCVRGNANADTRPLYTGVLWVDGPPAAAGHLRGSVQVKGDVASCSVPGEVDMEQGWLHAHVNPSMLHGESGEVHLRLRITKFP